MTAGLQPENLQRLEGMAQLYNTTIIIYTVDTAQLQQLPTQEHLPLPTYFRFILPLVLPAKRLYYIDADIICLQSAHELFAQDFEDNIIIAVPDLEWMNRKRNKALGITNHRYFNAGMLVIDVVKWNSFEVFNKVLEAITANPEKFKYLDQDALNLVLQGQVKYLSPIFNCIDAENIDKDKIVLLHFAAQPKPWNVAFLHSKNCTKFNRDLYDYYELRTPWAHTPLDQPRNYKEYKQYARSLKRNKQYVKSLVYWLKYFKTKYLK